jgi:transcriptional regulator with XRE-family HTH domain
MAASPNPIDIHVGRRLRERRAVMGLSQERLGEILGVTFQQIQKYERGANRIGSSRLLEICRALEVPSGYFFEGAPQTPAPASAGRAPGLAEEAATFDLPGASALDGMPDPFERRETLELVRAFNRITDPLVRRRLFELTKALAAMEYRSPAGGPGEP